MKFRSIILSLSLLCGAMHHNAQGNVAGNALRTLGYGAQILYNKAAWIGLGTLWASAAWDDADRCMQYSGMKPKEPDLEKQYPRWYEHWYLWSLPALNSWYQPQTIEASTLIEPVVDIAKTKWPQAVGNSLGWLADNAGPLVTLGFAGMAFYKYLYCYAYRQKLMGDKPKKVQDTAWKSAGRALVHGIAAFCCLAKYGVPLISDEVARAAFAAR